MSESWDKYMEYAMGCDTLSEYSKGKLRATAPPLKCGCGSEHFEVWHEFWGQLIAQCAKCGNHHDIGHEHNACRKFPDVVNENQEDKV